MSESMKLVASLIFVIVSIDYVKSECAQQTPCHCVSAEGYGYSLEALATLGSITSTNGLVTFQPCKNGNLTFNMTTNLDCETSSLCLLTGKNSSKNMGTIEETHWSWPLDKIPELIIKHTPYESHIEIVCSLHDDTPVLTLQSVTNTLYKFQLASTKLCPQDLRSRGLSTGSVLVILLLVFVGLYFIGGGLILTYCGGAIGRETIPNYEFWSDLPALVKDGVTFTLSGCSSRTYERI